MDGTIWDLAAAHALSAPGWLLAAARGLWNTLATADGPAAFAAGFMACFLALRAASMATSVLLRASLLAVVSAAGLASSGYLVYTHSRHASATAAGLL